MATTATATKAKTVTLHERLAPRGRVVGNTIMCCKLGGVTSKNGRRYLASAYREALPMYDGCPVVCGPHSDQERSYRDVVGHVRNPYVGADGALYGDVEVNAGSEVGRMLLHDAEHNPSAVGLSHHISGETRPGRDGMTEVTKITSVRELTLVLYPATTGGLYEASARRAEVTAWSFPKSADEMVQRLREADSDTDLGELTTPAGVPAMKPTSDLAGDVLAILNQPDLSDQVKLKMVRDRVTSGAVPTAESRRTAARMVENVREQMAAIVTEITELTGNRPAGTASRVPAEVVADADRLFVGRTTRKPERQAARSRLFIS